MNVKRKQATEQFKRGVNSRKFFDLPKEIEEDIRSRGWVYRWGATTKLAMQNGSDHRGYQAYRVPMQLRKTAEPGVYLEDYQVSPDGLFHRGDMTLMIMPKSRQDENIAKIKEDNRLNRKSIEAALEGRGISVEEMKFERQAIVSKNIEEEDNG